jgi:dsRNA-specific ribonuclease
MRRFSIARTDGWLMVDVCGGGGGNIQRLEFLGDAAVGLAAVKYFLKNNLRSSQGQLTLNIAAVVNNESLALVALRWQLHKYLRHESEALGASIRAFVAQHEMVQGAWESKDGRGTTTTKPAPKVLADLVESLAGAVMLDAGFDMQEGMRVITNVLLPELQRVAAAAPDGNKNPVALVRELCAKLKLDLKLDFSSSSSSSSCKVVVDGMVVASGQGSSSKSAERTACLAALCHDMFGDYNGGSR